MGLISCLLEEFDKDECLSRSLCWDELLEDLLLLDCVDPWLDERLACLDWWPPGDLCLDWACLTDKSQ